MKAKDILIPTLTLFIIALVTSALLVVTNGFTKDKIAALQEQSNREARQAVLPEADDFTERGVIAGDAEYTFFEANNGAGYVFSTEAKGYGGAVVVMTGITADGQVAGIKITEQNETPGLGQKALDAAFTDQYKENVPANGFVVTKSGKTASEEINALAGATITTNAVTNAVNEAIDIFELVTGGAN